MSKTRFYGAMAILWGLALVTVACGQAGPAETADGMLKLYVTDAPPDRKVTSIMVTVSEVQVHRAGTDGEEGQTQTVSSNQTEPDEPVGGEWISIEINDAARTFDLLKVMGIEQYLGKSEIEAAKYTQVRLVIEEVKVEFANSGVLEDARVPSNKLRIAHPFRILKGQTTALVIDFDADRMVTVTGNGDIIVKPVVKLTTRQERLPGQQIKLEDTKWVLKSYGEPENMADVPAEPEITAEFISSGGTVRGSAGCNSYSGSYELEDDRLTIGPVASTEMFCMEPEGVMDREQEYLGLLQLAESYEIAGDELTINSGGQVLVFENK